MSEIQNLPPPSSSSNNRIIEIDILRGFIMILMAIDHVSFFVRKVHFSEVWGFSIPAYHGLGEFFTRYITHVAPTGFFLLMGVGITLSKDKKTTLYYMRRALIIYVLHIFVEYRLWNFVSYKTNPSVFRFGAFPGTYGASDMELGVLFALSVSLLIWGMLRHLDRRVILVGSLFSLMLPSLLIPLFSPQNTPTLFQQLLFVPFRGNGIFLLYPVLPWLGLCGLGLYLGENILTHSKKLLKIGFLLSAVFFIIRLSGFGSLYSASKLSDGVIPFLSMVKYPADLSFITLTLSILFILMTLLLLCPSYVKKRLHFLKVFGKEPLFFYFAHLILYASLSPYFPNGASVQMLYLIWLISLPVLFLLCFGWHKLKIILSEKWDS